MVLFRYLKERKKSVLEPSCVIEYVLKGMATHSGKTIQSKYFPSEKEFSLQGKNLLQKGANSFLLEKIFFQKCFGVQKEKQKVTKVVSLVNKWHKIY